MKVKDMVLVAMFAAITAVLAQIAIPLPFTPVPITLQPFAVVLAGAILGSRKGALALIVYTLMGAVGLPVFAKFGAGLSVLLGPTGGYIYGFIIAAFVIGKIVESSQNLTYNRTLLAMVVGLIPIYILGMVQLAVVYKFSMGKAFALGVAPYVPLDIAKVVLGAYIGYAVRKAVVNSVHDF